MGCGQSQLLHVYAQRPEVAAKREIYEAFSFKQLDIGRLHKVYRKIDNDGSNSIELAELLAFLDLDRTRFTKRIFTMFDEDSSGLLDFHEFVLSLWNYCTLTKSSLVLFAFDLYDKDNSGTITNNEVMDMLKDLYGKDYKKNPQAKLISTELEALEALDGDVDIDDFREFSRTHPALLFLAFQMQEKIQKYVMGPTFWRHYSERRIEISNGRLYVPIFEFMEIYVNPKLKDALEHQEIGMGKPIEKRDIGFVQQRKLDGKVSRKAKLVLQNSGSISSRRKSDVQAAALRRGVVTLGENNSTVVPINEDFTEEESREFHDKLNIIKEVYEAEAVDKRAEAITKHRHERRGSVMPGAEGENIPLAAGMKVSTKKGRRQSLRRSFDSITAEKSKALYNNDNMFSMKDSHIHSVAEALMQSERMLKENKHVDPDKHNAISAEFKSFSKHTVVPPPSQQQSSGTGDPSRRGSVVPGKVNRRVSQRRSFDGVTSRR